MYDSEKSLLLSIVTLIPLFLGYTMWANIVSISKSVIAKSFKVLMILHQLLHRKSVGMIQKIDKVVV